MKVGGLIPSAVLCGLAVPELQDFRLGYEPSVELARKVFETPEFFRSDGPEDRLILDD
jgi:hypothetical protein